MKFLRAHFSNFRILQDIEFSFSRDPEKHLTVVRAENESGKTTALLGLQWALYGDDALPGQGKGFRLHPIDWPAEGPSEVRIQVELDLEHEIEIPSRRGQSEAVVVRKRLRLVRTAVELVKGTEFRRAPSTVTLAEITERGHLPVEPPEAELRQMLPPELREVFFTDGDRALSFIQAEVSTTVKRKRVADAVRSLLGLSILESTLDHLKQVTSVANKALAENAGAGEVQRLSGLLEKVGEAQTRLEREQRENEKALERADVELAEVSKELAQALARGDREKLARELTQTQKLRESLGHERLLVENEHSALFRRLDLALGLVGGTIKKAQEILQNLKDRGTIPSAAIPVLSEHLELARCICGESLDPATEEGVRRRGHIEGLIAEQKRSDSLREHLTSLYYGTRAMLSGPATAGTSWSGAVDAVQKRRVAMEKALVDAEKRERALELELASIADTDVSAIRTKRNALQQQKDQAIEARGRLSAELRQKKQNQTVLLAQRDSAMRSQSRYKKQMSQAQVLQDLQTVVGNAYQTVIEKEVREVGREMETLFLRMIEADPEQQSLIQRAEITREFDIKVWGPFDRELDPDRDLNGASRRALTLAFILALTRVSGYDAPNVIDTPLGMTSGTVKRSILQAAIEKSTQLVLFLTRSEIRGCEDILTETGAYVITLSNSAHYPRMLKNKPPTERREIIRCDCDHLTVCETCDRWTDGAESERRG